MKKFAKIGLKKVFSAAIISGLIATAVGYSFVSSAAGTITLASSGRFEYDADGNGVINGAAGDVILDSDDLVSLRDAVTGLNSSLTALQTQSNNYKTAAYGTDGVPNHTGKLKNASGTTLTGDPTDLEKLLYDYQTSHSYTNTQYEQNANQIIKTVAGNATADCIYYIKGHGIGMTFQPPENSSWDLSSLRGRFFIWSGRYTAAELVAGISRDGVVLNDYAALYNKWSEANQEVGFMGYMIVATVSNATNGGSGVEIQYANPGLKYLGNSESYSDRVGASIFTLAPICT